MCLIFPVSNYDDMCEMLSTKQAHWRLAAQGFTEAWSQKSQAPRRKTNVQLIPHCLYKQLRHIEPLLSVMEWCEPSLNPRLQIPAKGQPLQAGLCKDSRLEPAMGTLLHSPFLGILTPIHFRGSEFRTSKWLHFVNHKDLFQKARWLPPSVFVFKFLFYVAQVIDSDIAQI